MLKPEIKNLQQKISKSSMKVHDGLNSDLIKIMSKAEKQKYRLSSNFSGRNKKNIYMYSEKHQSVTIQ